MYIFWKYTFKAIELNIMHKTKIKKGNGAFRFDIALTTLNEHALFYSVYNALHEMHFKSEHN